MFWWLALHLYLALVWAMRGPAWVSAFFIFAVAVDLTDYRRTLLKPDDG